MTSKFLTGSLSKIAAATANNKPSSLLLASSKHVRKLATAVVVQRAEESYVVDDFHHHVVFGVDTDYNVSTTGTIAAATAAGTTTSNCPCPSFIVLDGSDRRLASFTPSQRLTNNSSLELYGSPLYYFSTESQQQQQSTSTSTSPPWPGNETTLSVLSESQEEQTMMAMEEYPVLGTWIHRYGFFRQQQEELEQQHQAKEEHDEEKDQNQSFLMLA